MRSLRLLLIRLVIVIGLLSHAGCQSSCQSRGLVGRQLDSLGARISFTRWNLGTTYDGALNSCRCECSTHANRENCARALELASRSQLDLESLLRRQPAPTLEMLPGKWYGINKGLGASSIGLTQDIKYFEADGCRGNGYNIAVHQVPIKDLACRGYQEVTKLLGCETKTMGNFVIIQPCSHCQPLKLDYTQADNSWLSPSKRLVDELVMIDQDLLLGRANIQLGRHLTPIAYFVLFRGNSQACDEQGQAGY